jgi:hypothetical protein
MPIANKQLSILENLRFDPAGRAALAVGCHFGEKKDSSFIKGDSTLERNFTDCAILGLTKTRSNTYGCRHRRPL